MTSTVARSHLSGNPHGRVREDGQLVLGEVVAAFGIGSLRCAIYILILPLRAVSRNRHL